MLASDSFKDRLEADCSRPDREIDQHGVYTTAEIVDIIEGVARHFDKAVEDITIAKCGNNSKNLARWVAMKLSQDVGGVKLTEIARHFNVGHYSTVSQTIGRLNRLMDTEAALAERFNVLSQDLTP